jgi:hypothetical protein
MYPKAIPKKVKIDPAKNKIKIIGKATESISGKNNKDNPKKIIT